MIVVHNHIIITIYLYIAGDSSKWYHHFIFMLLNIYGDFTEVPVWFFLDVLMWDFDDLANAISLAVLSGAPGTEPGVGQKNMDEATEGLGNVKHHWHHWLRSPRSILGNTPNFVCVFRWGQICVYQGCSNLLQVHHCHMQGWHIQEITKKYLQISTLFPPQTYVGWPGSNPL